MVTYTPNLNFNGNDIFKYTVKDNGNLVSNEATVSITVNPINDAPVASDDTPTTDEDVPVAIDVLANDTDVDDGINAATVTITATPSNGTLSINATTGVVTYTPNLNFNGNDIFKYTVKDNGNLVSNEATVSITVNPINDAPVASDDTPTTDEDVACGHRCTGQ